MKQQFLKKMIAAYAFIVLLYTLIAVGVYFYKNNEIVQSEFNHKHKVLLEQSQDRIDTKFMVAFNMINQFRIHDEMIQYARSAERDAYNTTQVFNELRKNLGAFYNFSYTLSLMRSQDDLVITPDSTMNLERYWSESGFPDEALEQLQSYIRSASDKPYFLVHRSPDKDYQHNGAITMVKKERLDPGELIVFVTFSEEYLLPKLGDDNHESFLIVNGKEVLYQLSSGESLADQPAHSRIAEAVHTINRYTHTELADYSLHAIHSNVLADFKYVLIAPQHLVRLRLASLWSDSLQVYLLLAFVGIGLAFIMARKMYKPIRNIIQLFHSYGSNEANDEFTYIQETAKQITNQNDSLRETIRHHQGSLRMKFLRDLTVGLAREEQWREQIGAYGFGWMREVSVIILQFFEELPTDEPYSDEALLAIKKRATLLMKEQLELSGRSLELFELDYRRYVIILQDIDTARVRRELSNVLSEFEIDLNVPVIAAIGNPAFTTKDIERSYHSALQLLDYRFAFDRRMVLTSDDLKQLNTMSYYYPLDVERDLIGYVIQGKAEPLRKLLLRIWEVNFVERTIAGEDLSKFVLALVATVNRILQQVNKSSEDIFEGDTSFYIELMECRSHEKLRDKAEEILHTLISRISTRNVEMDNTFADQMIEYIHTNYHHDLSLTNMAEHFDLSPSYISLLFKTYTGENFKDFLNIYRVTKAKELLASNTDLKINEVAGLVGCNHANTFIRMFKKYEGVSPGQFAKAAGRAEK